jgi:hypothetical protein
MKILAVLTEGQPPRKEGEMCYIIAFKASGVVCVFEDGSLYDILPHRLKVIDEEFTDFNFATKETE